jgi:tetratricopeptide (TPR) repeat protein
LAAAWAANDRGAPNKAIEMLEPELDAHGRCDGQGAELVLVELARAHRVLGQFKAAEAVLEASRALGEAVEARAVWHREAGLLAIAMGQSERGRALLTASLAAADAAAARLEWTSGAYLGDREYETAEALVQAAIGRKDALGAWQLAARMKARSLARHRPPLASLGGATAARLKTSAAQLATPASDAVDLAGRLRAAPPDRLFIEYWLTPTHLYTFELRDGAVSVTIGATAPRASRSPRRGARRSARVSGPSARP